MPSVYPELSPLFAPRLKEYVSSFSYGVWSDLKNDRKTLPTPIDDISTNFDNNIYEQMLLDAQVRASVNLLIYGIVGGGVEVVPATPSSRDQDVAKFIRDSLNYYLDETPLVTEVLPDMLHAMAFGNRICEIVWNPPDPAYDRNRWTIRRVKVKERRSVAFHVDGAMNVIGITAQWPAGRERPPGTVPNVGYGSSYGSSIIFPINHPLYEDQFGWISWKPKDSVPTGTSDLRGAYTPWWFKKQAEPEYLRYLANFAIGSLWMELSENASSRRNAIMPDGTLAADTDSDPVADGLAMLEQFQNASVAVVPNGNKINTIQSTSDGRPFAIALDIFNDEIVKAITGQVAATTKDGGAGRAPVVGQEILNMPVTYGRMVGEQFIKRFIVKRLMKRNYSRLTPMPQIFLPGLNKDDFLTTASGMEKLMAQNLFPPEMWEQIYMKTGFEPPAPEVMTKLTDHFYAMQKLEANPPKPTTGGFGG